MDEQPGPEAGAPSPAVEATLKFATALVQDGISGVTVIVPRAPGVLRQARGAAQVAGVSVRADNVGSAMITMRFWQPLANVDRAMNSREPRARRRRRASRHWMRFLGWLGTARL